MNVLKISLITCLFFSFLTVSFGQSSLKKANKEYELQAYNLAIKSYKKYLNRKSSSVEALSKIADCYRQLNQLDYAIEYYDKAVKHRGIDPIHLFNFAQCLQMMGKYDRAKEWYLIYGEAYPEIGTHFAESCKLAKTLQAQAPLFNIYTTSLNSNSSDFGIAFFKDQIIFASSRTDIKHPDVFAVSDLVGGSNNQLFKARFSENGALQNEGFLRASSKNAVNEGPISYSSDGQWVAYTKNNFVNGTRQVPSTGTELALYIAQVDASGDWTDDKPFEFNGSGYSTGYPCFSPDGNQLFFASNRPDGYGGFDIFVSQRTNSGWSVPENLGPGINSSGDEISPFYDDTNLYFSSNWHHGLGGFDIFKAVGSLNNFNEVYNLGNGINSSQDDYGLIYDGPRNLGFFVSNRMSGKGNEDIYRFAKNTDNFLITVLDGENNPIENADVDFSACNEPTFKTNLHGQHKFQTISGLNCEVLIKKEGYDPVVINIIADASSDNKNYEVRLNKENEVYVGKVIDSGSNEGIDDVLIRATNQADGTTTEVRSDAIGEYNLVLVPGGVYVVNFSKATYTNMNKTVKTDNLHDRSILGIATMVSSATVLTVPEETYPDMTGSGQVTSVPDVATTPTSPAPTDYYPEVQAGYAVQIAAVGRGQTLDLDKYSKAGKAGPVYAVPIDAFNKVRVGVFDNRSAANEAKNILRSVGYKNAFVVEQEGSRTSSSSSSSSSSSASAQTTYEPQNTTPSNAAIYKVRLASYTNPENFDAAKVIGLGILEEFTKGQFTVMLLSGFVDAKAAEVARLKAINKGFQGAHIVVERNGELEKIEF